MKIEVEQIQEFIKPYIFDGKKSVGYSDMVKLSNDLKVHFDGIYPGELIDKSRPSESDTIKEYRKSIMIEATKDVCTKIINSLSKIRRSPDWSIKYDSTKVSNKIAKGESLQDYCEFDYPEYTSITNWIFSECLKTYLVDPNAVVILFPYEMTIELNEYYEPMAHAIFSDQIIDYKSDKYCLIKAIEKSEYIVDGQKKQGDIYYLITDYNFYKLDQNSDNKGFNISIDWQHNLGYLPAFKLKGVFKKKVDTTTIYESRVASIVPRLNEALREYSDLQAEVIQHIHSEKWMYQQQECSSCKGTTKQLLNGIYVTCTQCRGTGSLLSSPYSTLIVKPANMSMGQQTAPIPPAGYIEKNIEIVKIQDERIDKHIYKALGSINMEFLVKTPMNESGVAKEVDRDELNNFVHSIAEDIVRIMDDIYYIINDIRYSIIVPNKDERKQMLPNISVPERFDLLSSNYLLDEIKVAHESKLNNMLIGQLNIEYANKKFNSDPMIKKMLQLIFAHDPLPGYTIEDKMSMLADKGIRQIDYVISCNMFQLIKQAINDDSNFINMDYDKQHELILKLGDQIVKDNMNASMLIDTSNQSQ